MHPSMKSSVFTTVKFFAVFCSVTYYLPLVNSDPFAIDSGRLHNYSSKSLDFNTTVTVRRSRENQWGIKNLGDDNQNLLEEFEESGLLPFVESGECQRGWIYKIERGEDLLKFRDELECIFFSGKSPSKVPLGPLYGSVLSILKMEEFDEIVNLIWWGKLINEVECSGPSSSGNKFNSPPRPIYLGWNNVLRHILVPFVATLGPIRERLVPGEFYDGKSNLIIDYTQDFSQLCDNFEDLQKSEGMNIPERNVFPLNQIVDALRFVGRQSDGASILLGKTYLRNSALHWSSTVIYFYFLNYDLGVNPEFRPGQELPPLEQSFIYTIPGIGSNL